MKLSYEDYFEMIDCLHDDRFSREGMFRMKCLSEVNAVGIPSMALYMLPLGYMAAQFITGRSRRSHSGYRYLFTTFSVTYPMACMYGYSRPIPRRLHTEIICDQGEDGTYVR